MRRPEHTEDENSHLSRNIYETVRRNGEEELERPLNSLLWSGVAAGILISYSVLAEAILRSALPDTPWRYLVENLGYCFGFLLVIIGRMQLFTENTITTILPLVSSRSAASLWHVLRLWTVVLVANVVGAAIAAGFMAHSGALGQDLSIVVADLSHHATGFPPMEAFVRGIPAGILVASIVWMLPGQQGNDVLLIVLFTWLIAAGDFTHIIAGSVEMWFLLLQQALSVQDALFNFFLPVLFGNVIGGTAVFTLLAWGQVKAEVEPSENARGEKPGTGSAQGR